jgi:hypothetical protein
MIRSGLAQLAGSWRCMPSSHEVTVAHWFLRGFPGLTLSQLVSLKAHLTQCVWEELHPR